MTLKDNCMCLEDLEQRTARIKNEWGTDTAVSPRLLAVSQPEPLDQLIGRWKEMLSIYPGALMRGHDSLSLEMAGLNKDHGEKDKTSESSYGTQEGVARGDALGQPEPWKGTGIKRFTLCWNELPLAVPLNESNFAAIIRCLFSSQLSNISPLFCEVEELRSLGNQGPVCSGDWLPCWIIGAIL